MKKILLFITAIIIVSCEKTIEFNGTVEEPKIVINSIFDNSKNLTVSVAESRSIMDGKSLRILSNAVVKVSDGTNEHTLLFVADKNIFESGFKPKINKKYSITASYPGYSSISSSSYCPDTVKQVTHTVSSYRKNSELRNKYNIEFNDLNPNKENYYLITVDNIAPGKEDEFDNNIQIRSNDNNIVNRDPYSDEDEEYFDYLLISDNNFEDGKISVNFSVRTTESYLKPDESSNFYNYYENLNVYHLTYEAFQYIKTLELYPDSKDNPFAQPVQIYTNIDNGLGIFAGTGRRKVNLLTKKIYTH